jgi:hypothetical protein
MPHCNGSSWIWRTTRIAIYLRDGMDPRTRRGGCLACGRGKLTSLVRKRLLSLDHVSDPRLHTPDNLVTLCGSCNSSRGSRPFSEWRPDLLTVVAAQVALELPRALARELCEELWPARLERQREKCRRARARGPLDALDFNPKTLELAS